MNKKLLKKGANFSTVLMFVILCLYSIALLGLLVWALIASFKKGGASFFDDPIGFPNSENFKNNYATVFDWFKIQIAPDGVLPYNVYFEEMMLNSLMYSIGCAFFNTLATYIVAYCCARYKFVFSKIVYAIAVAYMVTPIIGTLPSSIKIAQALGIFGTMYGIWIMNATFLGIYFLVFYEIFKSLPEAYFEAAKIDGANDWHLLGKIALPITITSFATVFLINFIKYWNDYQTPLIFVKTKPVISYGLMIFIGEHADVPQIMTASIVVLLPVLLLFILTNKKLMGNITIGGIKG